MAKHQWKLDADGERDDLAGYYFDSDGDEHNGPICVKCGHTYCGWCHMEDPEAECEAE